MTFELPHRRREREAREAREQQDRERLEVLRKRQKEVLRGRRTDGTGQNSGLGPLTVSAVVLFFGF
jgi:uncharacterized protein YciI